MAEATPIMMRTESFELDGKLYTLTIPPIKETRTVMDIVNRITPIMATLKPLGLGTVTALVGNGNLSQAEVDKLSDLFLKRCTVDFGDDRVGQLGKDAIQDELWADAIESQYDWLTACMDIMFKGLLGKSTAVVDKLKAARAAETTAAEG
jgi:hypothetical protein